MKEVINGQLWIRCNYCGHKLMKLLKSAPGKIEVKCHSCKAINIVDIDFEDEKGEDGYEDD